MSTPNISRDVINQVVTRLQNDPSFKAQANADPATALQSMGLPPEIAGDFIHEGLITPDVQGYSDSLECLWTCVVSGDIIIER